MTSDVYARRGDLYKYGLPRGLLGLQGRVVRADASADTFELNGHGFEDDDRVVFRAAEGGSLPTGISASTVYYAKRVTDAVFQVAATAGGSAVTFSTSGAAVLAAAPLPIDEVLEYYSRWVDDVIPQVAPLTADESGLYPVIVRGVVAELSARKLLWLSGQRSETVDAYELAAKAQLERWAKGAGVRDSRQKTANLSVSSAVSTAGDPRGWGSKELP